MKILKKLFKFILRPYLYITISNFLYSLIYRKRKKLILTKDIKYSLGILPVLCFAGKAPKPNEIASGGRVKLIELSNAFPEKENEFNILYLVSSALPEHFEEWIKKAQSIGAKIVVNQNGVLYKACFGSGYQAANLKNKFLLKSADYVIYQSQFCKNTADKFVTSSIKNFDILYNPVNTSIFYPQKKNSIKEDIVLFMGGTYNSWYRIETGLKTLSYLKKKGYSVRLIIAGRYSKWINCTKKETDLFSTIKALGIDSNVELLGSYLQSDAPALMNKANILLHPQYNDASPTLVAEAMACGLPVVYSNSGGTPEIVGREAGIGIDSIQSYEMRYPPDPVKMADAVSEICENVQSYSEAARARAIEYFDIKRWLDKHDEVFKRILI